MINLEFTQIRNAINFSNSIETKNKENIKKMFEFLLKFKEIYKKEKNLLPYHFNLIDELHADENAHSRIFAKLLRYKEKNKYPFLENFLNNVCGFNVKVESPKVKKVDSCGRIDIPIFDKKYVVVVENKVTDKAPDQNNLNGGQLARYIETIENDYNRNLEEIFVVYTPKYNREPSNDSWKNKNKFSYKRDFSLRFRSASYRDKIYPWLKNEILPSINEKDIYLRSAVEQYIDFLEGMFSIRTIDKNMNMKLQEFIKEELGLEDGKLEEAIGILVEKEQELNNAINQILKLKRKYQKLIVKDYFDKWEKLLKTDYPTFEIVSDKFNIDKNYINVGVKFHIDNQTFAAIIEYKHCDKPRIYFGVGRHFASNPKYETPHEVLKEIFENNNLKDPNDYWYGKKNTSKENAFMRLTNLIKEINTLIKVQK